MQNIFYYVNRIFYYRIDTKIEISYHVIYKRYKLSEKTGTAAEGWANTETESHPILSFLISYIFAPGLWEDDR